MKVNPTLEGGLRIDAADESDWNLLRAIIVDAGESDLASVLGDGISEEAGATDWEELVVPDLREGFQDNLAEVAAAIESAVVEAEGETGALWIKPENAFAWYSALNQARLALEEQHHFSAAEEIEALPLTVESSQAFIRSEFYQTIQEFLLQFVMRDLR